MESSQIGITINRSQQRSTVFDTGAPLNVGQNRLAAFIDCQSTGEDLISFIGMAILFVFDGQSVGLSCCQRGQCQREAQCQTQNQRENTLCHFHNSFFLS